MKPTASSRQIYLTYSLIDDDAFVTSAMCAIYGVL